MANSFAHRARHNSAAYQKRVVNDWLESNFQRAKANKMKYIQRRDGKYLETVDEFETYKEAKRWSKRISGV